MSQEIGTHVEAGAYTISFNRLERNCQRTYQKAPRSLTEWQTDNLNVFRG